MRAGAGPAPLHARGDRRREPACSPSSTPRWPACRCAASSSALEQWKGDLFDAVDAGVTAAAGGIADTGTLVLRPGAAEPRTLSLVPAVHVAVLRASCLYASLPAALQALAPPPDLPSNLLLVSGPSKTADIQQVLAYGAHGPKVLVIVLVHDLDAAGGASS